MICTKNSIRAECKRIEEDSIHSAKGHYNAASFWKKLHYLIGIPMTILAAWAGVDAFSIDPNLAGYLALASATLGALQTFLGANGKASQHKIAADEYLSLRNKTRLLREIKLPNLEIIKADKYISDFSKSRDKLNKISPAIPYFAFIAAKKGIDKGQSEYKIDNGENK
jgi:hypothetical protein